MKHTSVGQLLLVGVQGLELGVDETKLLRRVQPGGFILFGRNIKTPEQLRKLVDDLRNLSLVEPIITIDQEGGRVSRLRLIGNEPPSAQQLRDKGDIELIRQHGDITGDLLRLFGFNLDLPFNWTGQIYDSRSVDNTQYTQTNVNDNAVSVALGNTVGGDRTTTR